MSITITCQARVMTTFSPKLAIRLNKKYVAEVGNKETIALDIPNNMTLLSYQFLDYPNIKVSNGDHIIIKRNYITLTIRWAYILIYFFFIYFFKKNITFNKSHQHLFRIFYYSNCIITKLSIYKRIKNDSTL